MEIWKNISFDKRYTISNYGNIISNVYNNPRKIKLQKTHNGYLRIRIKGDRYLVHRLVAQHFITNIEKKSQVNHKDGNKLNNNVNNLEWCNNSDNQKHAHNIGLKRFKLSLENVIKIRSKYSTGNYSQKELAEEYNVSKSTMCSLLNNKIW